MVNQIYFSFDKKPLFKKIKSVSIFYIGLKLNKRIYTLDELAWALQVGNLSLTMIFIPKSDGFVIIFDEANLYEFKM